MTNECWICGKQESMQYKCRYCGKTYCSDHRLPEQHGCEGFDGTAQRRFSGTHGNTYSQNADTERLIKDMLKNTAKNAAKGAAIGIFDRIKRSMYASPSMAIIYVCVVSFFLQSIIRGYVDFFWLFPTSPQYLILFTKPWTLITHMFLHANLTHLFFNMLVLFFFGRELERRVGNRVFWNVFFTSGIVAAIGYTLTGTGPMIGASGAIYGVFACMAILAPEMKVYVYFIPMRIKYALVLFALMDFLLIGAPDMIAHTAHLSGLFVGVIMGMRIKKAYLSRRFGKAHDYYSKR
ncbi:MAG: rhomboid family intramembrane serine protease [Methanosarcinaceae archaeon]|nr:rhomboid family intramembrane serine protease [Methanosarcinaceae archaeon]